MILVHRAERADLLVEAPGELLIGPLEDAMAVGSSRWRPWRGAAV